MDLTQAQRGLLVSAYNSERHCVIASEPFTPGHGGLWRPIPPPERFQEMIALKLMTLEEHGDNSYTYPSKARCRWYYQLTDLGVIMAKMILSEDA